MRDSAKAARAHSKTEAPRRSSKAQRHEAMAKREKGAGQWSPHSAGGVKWTFCTKEVDAIGRKRPRCARTSKAKQEGSAQGGGSKESWVLRS